MDFVKKIFIYAPFFMGALACSSSDKWNPKSLDNALATLDKEEKVNYGPQLIPEQKSRTGFIDQTEQYGLSGLSASSIMAVDFNGDEFTDLAIIRDYFSQPEFFLFNPTSKKFEKIDSLFSEPIKASFILFYDLNGDKITDALTGVLNQGAEVSERPLRVFYGKRKNGLLHFEEHKDAIKLEPKPTATAVLIDYDLDGDLDLFMGNWFSKYKNTSLPERDRLFENRKGEFVEVELLEGEGEQNPDKTMYVNAAPTFAAQVCDMDLNGFPDILTSSTNSYLNKLWMNMYKTRAEKRYFRDYGVLSSYAGDPEGILNSRGGGRTFSSACADYNHDGIMDAFMGEVSHNHDSDSIDKSSILTGSTRKFPPKFLRTEYALDAHDLRWNQSDKRGIWFDYNNDGLLDLWVDNSGYPPHTRALLFKQYSDHSFENVSKEQGVDFVNPSTSVLIDVNADGKLDILSAQSDLRDARIKKRLYLMVNNNFVEGNRSLRFFLRGNRSNFNGLNATVELKVKTESGTERRIQQVAYSYGGLPPQNEEGVLFGLKKGEEPLTVKVIWPHTKTLNSGRAGLEKFYDLKGKLDFNHRLNVTLCEAGIWSVAREGCPDL